MTFAVNAYIKTPSRRECGYTLTLTEPEPPFSRNAGLLASSVRSLVFIFLVLAALPSLSEDRQSHAGPAIDHFRLTLNDGKRKEAVGPFFYDEQVWEQDNVKLNAARTWAIPPFFSRTVNPLTESEEYDFLYPVLTYDRFGDQYRWQIGQLFNFAGGPSQTETNRDRFSLFPLYMQQRSSDTNENYTSVFPVYGHLKNRLFRDEIYFVLFPCFGETRKGDVVTDNYLYPFFHLRHGNKLEGWQLWPITGHEHKDVTYVTNGFGDSKLIGGHDHSFIMWPLYMDQQNDLGTKNPQHQQASLPLYDFLRSPKRDQTTIIWPFFTIVDDRAAQYREWELPWPFYVRARGRGKHTDRIFPFYSRNKVFKYPDPGEGSAEVADTKSKADAVLESDFYMWPVWLHKRAHADPLDRERSRILFFVYSDTIEKNTETAKFRRRVDLWPFFTFHHELDGNERLQVMAILEPFIPNNKSIERNYSQVYSFWRSETNATTGATSKSLLWNLYRHETSAGYARTSAIFGLYQHERGTNDMTRICFIPVGRNHPAK
jgi:hypothetical protein